MTRVLKEQPELTCTARRDVTVAIGHQEQRAARLTCFQRHQVISLPVVVDVSDDRGGNSSPGLRCSNRPGAASGRPKSGWSRWPSTPGGTVLDCVVGGDESPEFLRQSRMMADLWGARGVDADPPRDRTSGGDDEEVLTLRDPDGRLSFDAESEWLRDFPTAVARYREALATVELNAFAIVIRNRYRRNW